MTIKDKIIFLAISIVTLGVYPYAVLKGSKTKESNTLSVGNKVTINVDKILQLIGKANIVGVSNTHTKVKIEIKSNSTVDVDAIKNIKGISGIFATSTSLTILVGNTAKLIADEIDRRK